MLVAGIGYGLLAGLDMRFAQRPAEQLTVVAVLPEPPPPRPEPVHATRQAHPRKTGAASPPNRTAHATEIIAPPPVIAAPPPPVVVARVAGVGNDSSAGAARVIGPGTGSGGQGDGIGSGAGGTGDGGGGGEIPLRLIHGRLNYGDLPRAVRDAGVGGVVGMHFIVGVKGRVTECRVTRSSGDRALDLATCDLITAKLRYRPTRDLNGRARADYVDGEQTWSVARGAGDEEDGARDDDRPGR